MSFWKKTDNETELEQKKAERMRLSNEFEDVKSRLREVQQRTENASTSRENDGRFAQAVKIQTDAAPEIARLTAKKGRLEREVAQVKKDIYALCCALGYQHRQCGTVFETRSMYESHLVEARRLHNPAACGALV